MAQELENFKNIHLTNPDLATGITQALGDVVVASSTNGSRGLARLPVGTNTYVLTANSSASTGLGLEWTDPFSQGFGSDFNYVERTTEFINDTSVFLSAVTLTTDGGSGDANATLVVSTPLQGGNYRISIAFEWAQESTGTNFEFRLILDGNTVSPILSLNSRPTAGNTYAPFSSFRDTINLSAGSHVFDVQIRKEPGGGPKDSFIRNIFLEVIRQSD